MRAERRGCHLVSVHVSPEAFRLGVGAHECHRESRPDRSVKGSRRAESADFGLGPLADCDTISRERPCFVTPAYHFRSNAAGCPAGDRHGERSGGGTCDPDGDRRPDL